MKKKSGIKVVVVGSVAFDSIATPVESRSEVLGGSASFACAAASFFAKPGMVGVVGTDFPEASVNRLAGFGIDLAGLRRTEGNTFRWSGVYEQDMNNRRTLSTCLNVFAGFSPDLPEPYRRPPFLFLANIAPELQLEVLSQSDSGFVAADTMDLWIKTAREPLMEVLARIDLLLLNDSEARSLTGESNLIKAAERLLQSGLRYALIKKGEHGSMLATRKGLFLMPAYPVENVRDPTGAGDAFGGGMIGFLAKAGLVNPASLRRAMVAGTVMASFVVESFGLDKLAALKKTEVARRMSGFSRMIEMPRRLK